MVWPRIWLGVTVTTAIAPAAVAMAPPNIVGKIITKAHSAVGIIGSNSVVGRHKAEAANEHDYNGDRGGET